MAWGLAYKSVTKPTPPVPKANNAARTPIDAFIAAKLKAHGLSFAAPADKRTFIRRATFDLIGLPPTEEQVRAFLDDQSPQAFEKVVDRLLASPQYGERQALFWLDLARFAESDGFRDGARRNAWRYRDYVIRSFNNDKPYDRFILEQLAGDELFPDDFDAQIATGFMRHFPDEHNAVNLEQRRQEILNDITDTTASVFLGITFGSAKCHDHKNDPVTQVDYYRFQAFFAGYWPIDALQLSKAERSIRGKAGRVANENSRAPGRDRQDRSRPTGRRKAKDSAPAFRRSTLDCSTCQWPSAHRSRSKSAR